MKSPPNPYLVRILSLTLLSTVFLAILAAAGYGAYHLFLLFLEDAASAVHKGMQG